MIEAYNVLKNNKVQLDNEGIMVAVSHQALDEVLAELDDLRNRVKFTTWKPIETAPKDKKVLIWTGQNIYVGKWVQNIGKGGKSFSILDFCGGEISVEDSTHWMPLPEAPTE